MIYICYVYRVGPVMTQNSLNDFFPLPSNKVVAVPQQNTSVKCHKTGYPRQESEVRTAFNCSGTLESNQW